MPVSTSRDIYLRNPNLKAAAVKHDFTADQISEYLKCQKDPIYFIETYMKIVSLDEGLVSFNLWPFQKKMINTFHKNRFVICKIPRQAGKTSTAIGYLLHHALFTDNQNIAILANKGLLAREILGRLQLAYENLPKWLQQGVTTWNKGSVELENGSKIIATATSSSAVRGNSYNVLLLDEFAFVPTNMAHEFFNSVYPTIASGKKTKLFIVSTPNGMNMFYKMWTDAINNQSNYTPIEIKWNDVPGRDEKWREETIANTSEIQFQAEFETQFIGAQNTLISPITLRNMPYVNPNYSNKGLDVFEEPRKDRTYAICVDVARGKGLDYSACVVVDTTEIPYKLVAKYRSNLVSPILFPDILHTLGLKYNTAGILVEVNDIGGQIADTLHHDLEYPNVMFSSTGGRAGQTLGGGFAKNIQYGVRTTTQMKRMGCSSLKTLIENGKLEIKDFDVIAELSSFVQTGNSYAAEEGNDNHDDLVMCLVIFAWMVNQKYFKESNAHNVRQVMRDESLKPEDLADLTPFGSINSWQNDSFIVENGERWEIVGDSGLLY